MWDQLARMAGSSGEDVGRFAEELQGLAGQGGFDPFSLLTGDPTLLGAVLAPLTPQLQVAMQQYQADGTGPMQGVVQQMQQQGLDAVQARERTLALCQAGRGMLVILLQHEQGITTLPQMHFDLIDQGFMDHCAQAVADSSLPQDRVHKLLGQLLGHWQAGHRFPEAVAAAEGEVGPDDFWSDCAERLVAGLDEGLLAGQDPRLADCAWWCQSALARLAGDDWDGADLLLAARCAAAAGALDEALRYTGLLLDAFEPEDEETLHLVEALARAGVAAREPQRVAAVLTERWDDLIAIFGGPCYEAALARLRCLAAAQAPAADLIAAVTLLQEADRKAYRHDLNREPLWVVAQEEPGELLDTADAAARIDRSAAFIAKRLEQGTIPVLRDGDQLRIPARGLDAWYAVMQQFGLLD